MNLTTTGAAMSVRPDRVLLVDDEEPRLRALGDQLLLDGYEVKVAKTAGHARFWLREMAPDAMVLASVGTPAETLGLLRALRRAAIDGADPRLPVLTLGADDESQAISHYKAATDIALPHDASPSLVVAGLESMRSRRPDSGERRRIQRAGNLTVDLDGRTVTFAGEPLALTRLEFDILEQLSSDPDRMFPRDELGVAVWGEGWLRTRGRTRTLDSHTTRLRKKLRAAGADELVKTVWGQGYRLNP